MAKNHIFGTPDQQLHEDKLNALVVEQDELVAAMAALPATTVAGQWAKAMAALTMLRDQIAPGEEELEDSMTKPPSFYPQALCYALCRHNLSLESFNESVFELVG